MKAALSKLIISAMSLLSWLLSQSRFEAMLNKLVQKRAGWLPADEALRFLFRLDAMLYSLEGPLAVTYGKGLHPKHRHTAYHEFFTQRVQAGEHVLDIGCGIGAVAHDLAVKGALVDGIDWSEASIAEANRRFGHPNAHFSVQDALSLEGEKHYDTVILSNVLEHIEERVKFLFAVQAKTKAQKILVRVPLFEREWRVPLKKELGVEWRLDPDHKTEYTLNSFVNEAKAANLEVASLEVHWGEIWSELRAV